MYVLFKTLSRSMWLHALVWWPATVMHELLHYFFGVMVRARPVGMSLWPRRIAGTHQVELGHVAFVDLRWWKALPVAVAPLVLLLPLGLYLVHLSLAQAHSQPKVLLLSFSVMQCFQGCWPSSQDWALARPAIYVIFALFLLGATGYAALRMGQVLL